MLAVRKDGGEGWNVVSEPDPQKRIERTLEIGWGGSVPCVQNVGALPVGQVMRHDCILTRVRWKSTGKRSCWSSAEQLFHLVHFHHSQSRGPSFHLPRVWVLEC